ncbi:MAG: peptidylprolyl isomerase [Thermoanaerobacteraceae bacterium]|nr:peptidylprolyl isomerase [Thermoanaerobacteraceae bacterium]
MKKLGVSVLLFVLIIAMTGCQNIEKVEPEEGRIIDGQEVIAKVNDDLILKSDYDRQVAQVKSALEANGQDFSTSEGKKILKDVKETVLQSMINDQLILWQAKEHNITLDDEEFNEAISQLEQYHGGKDALETYLKQQGFDRQSYEAQVKDQLIISKFREELTSGVNVTEDEIRQYYDENKEMFQLPSPEIRASHILVDTEDEAKEILAKIKDGADFEELAKNHSKDPVSKDLGGDLGYFSKGKMVPEFEEAAFALKPGQVSDVVKSEYGYHIIKVTGERTSVSFDDAKEYIKYNLENAKKDEEFAKYLEKWEKQSKIEKYL